MQAAKWAGVPPWELEGRIDWLERILDMIDVESRMHPKKRREKP
jgi:hypothetical protein